MAANGAELGVGDRVPFLEVEGVESDALCGLDEVLSLRIDRIL